MSGFSNIRNARFDIAEPKTRSLEGRQIKLFLVDVWSRRLCLQSPRSGPMSKARSPPPQPTSRQAIPCRMPARCTKRRLEGCITRDRIRRRSLPSIRLE